MFSTILNDTWFNRKKGRQSSFPLNDLIHPYFNGLDLQCPYLTLNDSERDALNSQCLQPKLGTTRWSYKKFPCSDAGTEEGICWGIALSSFNASIFPAQKYPSGSANTTMRGSPGATQPCFPPWSSVQSSQLHPHCSRSLLGGSWYIEKSTIFGDRLTQNQILLQTCARGVA